MKNSSVVHPANETGTSATPSYAISVASAHDVPSHPPPSYESSYDSISYNWVFGNAFMAITPIKPTVEVHMKERKRLQKILGASSAAIALALAAFIIISFVFFKRDVGLYTICNIWFCLVFVFGALVLCLFERQKTLQLQWATTFFIFLLVLICAGTPLAAYELSRNPSRVADYCLRKSNVCQNEEAMLISSYVVGGLCIVLADVLMALLMRLLFVFSCAVQRENEEEDAQKVFATMRSIAYYLPNLNKHLGAIKGSVSQYGQKARSFEWGTFFKNSLLFIGVFILCIAFLPCSSVFLIYQWNKSDCVAILVTLIWLGFFLALVVLCFSYDEWWACLVLKVLEMILGNL